MSVRARMCGVRENARRIAVLPIDLLGNVEPLVAQLLTNGVNVNDECVRHVRIELGPRTALDFIDSGFVR